jgi:hypothetical protein
MTKILGISGSLRAFLAGFCAFVAARRRPAS